MRISEAALYAQLRRVWDRPNAFEDLTEFQVDPPYDEPDRQHMLLGHLENGSLAIQDPGGDLRITLAPIEHGDAFSDAGILLPNGVYFVGHRLLSSGKFPVFRVEIRSGTVRFTPIPLTLRAQDISAANFLALFEGRGMLFYNNTERPDPLLGFMTYDIQESKSFEILFIDLCANFARNQLEASRVGMDAITVAAETRNEFFEGMLAQLRKKADLYYRLEALRDFFNLLTYLRYLGPTSWILSLTAERRNIYRELVEVTIPAMEARLVEAGHELTLDDLVEQMDEKLRRIRRGAPLLGRLRWDDIRRRSDEQIADAVRALVGDLLLENDQANGRLEADMENIRRALTIVPPRVMGVPRIVGTIERLQEEQIQRNARYFWAVEQLKSHAAGFQLVLGLSSAVFIYFCPPVGIALGIFCAVISVDQAIFHQALSNSDPDVDSTFVTQAEAREKWFWAGVDVLFAAVDVLGGLRMARNAVRSLGLADEVPVLPRGVDDLAELGVDTASEARRIGRMSEAADPNALARAADEIDPRTARADIADDVGRVDVSRSRQLEAPSGPGDAIENASPVVRQQIEPDLLPLVDAAYVRHFDEATELGRRPLTWDSFASDWYAGRMAEQGVPRIAPSPREGFYRQLAGPEGSMGSLLTDPVALRQRLVGQMLTDGAPQGIALFDQRFLRDLRRTIHRGASPAELDPFIQKRFFRRIDDTAARAGFPPGEGREFGLFALGAPNLSTWTNDACRSLRRLFEDVAVDNNALQRMITNESFTQHAATRGMNMELAIAFDRIRGVDGVLNRVDRINPPLFHSVATGNRGHGFEALLVSGLMDEATRQGARVAVGRRWWLRSIERVNAAEGTRYGNVLEADILVTHADGRRVLVDAKFYDRGLSINRTVDTQLAKMADGIEEGLIHNGEFWVSHHFVRSREGLTNLEAFQGAADMYSGGRIHLVYDTFESGFPGNFFQSSRFTEVSRGDAVLIPPPAPGVGVRGVSGPVPVPDAAAAPSPNAVVPVAQSIADLQPAVRQSETIRANSTVSRDLTRSHVPINPISSSGRVTVAASRVDAAATTNVGPFEVTRVRADTDIGGQPARDLAVGVLREVGKEAIKAAIGERDDEGELKFSKTRFVWIGAEPSDLYTVILHVAGPVAPGTQYQLALYSSTGELVRVLPDDHEGEPLESGWNVVPLTMFEFDGEFTHPLRPGEYQWVLRIRVNGRYMTYPQPLPMTVRPGEPEVEDEEGDED